MRFTLYRKRKTAFYISKHNLTASLGLKYVKVYDCTAEEMCSHSYCDVPTRLRPANDPDPSWGRCGQGCYYCFRARRYAYSALLLTSVAFVISVTEQALESYIFKARSTFLGSSFG